MKTLFESAFFFEAKDEKISKILIDKYGFLPEVADDMLEHFGKYALWVGQQLNEHRKQVHPDKDNMSFITQSSRIDFRPYNFIIKWIKASNGKYNLRDYNLAEAYEKAKEWQNEMKANIQVNMVKKWRNELKNGEMDESKTGMTTDSRNPSDDDYPEGIMFDDGSFWINLHTDDINGDVQLEWIKNDDNIHGNCGRDSNAETLFVLINPTGKAEIMASFSDGGKAYNQTKGSANSKPGEQFYMKIAYLLAKIGVKKYDGDYKKENDFKLGWLTPEQLETYRSWGGNEIEYKEERDIEEIRDQYREYIRDQGASYIIHELGYGMDTLRRFLKNEDEFIEEYIDDKISSARGEEIHQRFDSSTIMNAMQNHISVENLIEYLNTQGETEISPEDNTHSFTELYDEYSNKINPDELIQSAGADPNDIIRDIYGERTMRDIMNELGYDEQWLADAGRYYLDVEALANSVAESEDDEFLRSWGGE